LEALHGNQQENFALFFGKRVKVTKDLLKMDACFLRGGRSHVNVVALAEQPRAINYRSPLTREDIVHDREKPWPQIVLRPQRIHSVERTNQAFLYEIIRIGSIPQQRPRKSAE
jgi:hypothetical protein